MRMFEFLVDQSRPRDEWAALIGAVLGLPVALGESLSDAPADGVWGMVAAVDGDFSSHLQLYRIPEHVPKPDDLFYSAVASAAECAVLVGCGPHPYAVQVYRDGCESAEELVPT